MLSTTFGNCSLGVVTSWLLWPLTLPSPQRGEGSFSPALSPRGGEGRVRGSSWDQGGAGDGGRVPAVPLGGGEGLVDLVKPILVREEAVEGKAAARPDQEVQRPRDHPWVVLDYPHDLLGPPDQQRGLDLHLDTAADRADLQGRPAEAEHSE